jgi:hypothetical protein
MASRRAARIVWPVVGALLTAGLTVIGGAGPASATGSTIGLANSVQTAYIDSAHPDASYLNPTVDVPLGTWTDRGVHLARDYQVFDLSAFAHEHILSARLTLQETQATNCQDRQIEVWQTSAEPASPTWAKPRQDRALLATFGGTTLCPAFPEFDLTSVIAAASAHGVRTLPIEIRLASKIERKPGLFRTLAPKLGTLSVNYNHAPLVPTGLKNASKPCATQQPYPYVSNGADLDLGAVYTDPDAGDLTLTAMFQIWPVGHPDQTKNRLFRIEGVVVIGRAEQRGGVAVRG